MFAICFIQTFAGILTSTSTESSIEFSGNSVYEGNMAATVYLFIESCLEVAVDGSLYY